METNDILIKTNLLFSICQKVKQQRLLSQLDSKLIICNHESVDFTERLGLIVYMLSLITSLYYSIIHLFSLMSEANKPLDCNDDNKTPSVVGPKVIK